MSAIDRLIALAGKAMPAMIKPGHISRSDGLPVDETRQMLIERHGGLPDEEKEQNHALLSRMESVSDLEPGLYRQMCNNPTSVANWLPGLMDALDASGAGFLVPRTQIHRLPPELAQYIRLEHRDTDPSSRAFLNAWFERVFELPTPREKEIFLKTGMFSNKFEARNAFTDETDELGDYLHVVNNTAMLLGAGRSVDVCIREVVGDLRNDPEHPKIYSGLPLRCEFRSFVDLDAETGPRLLGLVDYWHPDVVGKVFRNAAGLGIANAEEDWENYSKWRDTHSGDFDEWKDRVIAELGVLLPHLADTQLPAMTGQWSVDIMVDGDDLYIIDLAPMDESALVDLLFRVDEYALVSPAEIKRMVGVPPVEYRPVPHPFPVDGHYDTKTREITDGNWDPDAVETK